MGGLVGRALKTLLLCCVLIRECFSITTKTCTISLHSSSSRGSVEKAYRRMFGTYRPTYEPVSMRAFRHGRTDTVRTVSTESIAFCDAMCSASSFCKGPEGHESTVTNLRVQKNGKLALLRAACAAHSEQTRVVAAGNGFDRHLLGLRLLLKKVCEDTLRAHSSRVFFASKQSVAFPALNLMRSLAFFFTTIPSYVALAYSNQPSA